MSETTQENTAPARPVKFKSNAPWVLGLIALLLAIPNLMCQMLCKEAVSTLDKATADAKEVYSATDKVIQNDVKALKGIANTLDAASKGDAAKALESGKDTLKSTADTLKAEAELADTLAKKSDSAKKDSAKPQEKPKDEGMKDFESFMTGSFFLCLGMFILSLFGKSKLSVITGIIIIAGAFGLFGWSLRWVQALGCVEGILFLFSGIFSITNRNKVK